MTILAISDPLLQTIVTTIVGAIVTVYLAKINKQGVKAAEGAAEVKQTLKENTDVTRDTHTLVNSNMGEQLKLTAELSRWKADQTGNPEHIRSAELAETKLREHEAKQANVDATKR